MCVCMCTYFWVVIFYFIGEHWYKAFTRERTFYGCYFMLGLNLGAVCVFNTCSLERRTLGEIIF